MKNDGVFSIVLVMFEFFDDGNQRAISDLINAADNVKIKESVIKW